MIESGSHTPGVRVADFGLPAGTALRYEQPAEPLRNLLPSYAVLDSEAALWSGPSGWLLPSWAQIWIVLAAGPIDVTVGARKYTSLGTAMLFGVTSRAMPVTASGGVSVVVDIGPLAWARLFAPSAELWRDKITPLEQLLPPDWTEELVARIAGSDRGSQVKGLLDDFFLQRMPPPHPHENLITRIAVLLADEGVRDLADAAEQVGIERRALLRLTKRYFGFPPKLLLIRTRFLRALTAMLVSDDPDFAAIPAGYYDVSHFIRDAKRFLGMTPRRFLAIEMPYLRAALRARILVTGTATPSLDRVNLGSGLIDQRQTMTVAAMATAEKKMGAAVIAGVDAAPVLELAEHVFDAVTLAIEGPVVRDLDLAVGF